MSALDLAETNKIRKALGLPPLGESAPSDGPIFKEKEANADEEAPSTLETRSAQATDNWARLERERQEQLRRNEAKEKIRKAREKAERLRVLEGKGLGDANEGEDIDTRSWLLGQKKRQKKIEKVRATKLAQELAEREQQAYTEKDLAGVHVGHSLDEFSGLTGDAILTLADKEIGKDDDDEEDELENAELRATQKLNEKLEAKKRKRAYNPLDFDDENRGILSQYDDEIDPKRKKKAFALAGDSTSVNVNTASEQEQGKNGMKISLDSILDDPLPTSDYMEPREIKVKKPKKKKEKSSRRKALEDDDIFQTGQAEAENDMEVDGATPPARKPDFDASLDDMDLQSQLAKRRQEALKRKRQQKKKLTPEELARQLREEQSEEPEGMDSIDDEDGPGLIINETSQFVANLRPATPPSERAKPKQSVESSGVSADAWLPSRDTIDVKMEDADSDEENKPEEETAAPASLTTTGLEEEATLNQVGIGAVLGMLNQRGLIETSGTTNRNSEYRDNQDFLQAKASLEAEYERKLREARERERQSGRMLSQKQREEENKLMNERMQLEKDKALARLFTEYRPTVEITYKDQYGRMLGAKEAFRELSHQFHGKGSGKQKTEKKLKKIDDEKKREAMSALDSSQHTGMSSAMGATARKNRQAGVRLE